MRSKEQAPVHLGDVHPALDPIGERVERADQVVPTQRPASSRGARYGIDHGEPAADCPRCLAGRRVGPLVATGAADVFDAACEHAVGAG